MAVVTVVTVVFIYDATQDYKVRWGNQNLILGIYTNIGGSLQCCSCRTPLTTITYYSPLSCFYFSTFSLYLYCISTVERPNRGHFGTAAFVLSSEVVFFSEVV